MKAFVKAVMVGLPLVYGSLALADDVVKGISCVADARPVDGPLIEVTLLRNAQGNYDVNFRAEVMDRRSGQAVKRNVTIASNLSCTFLKADPRIASCHRSNSESESINSGFISSVVNRLSAGYDGEAEQSSKVEVQVYSPVLAAGGPGVPHAEIGHYTTHFEAVKSNQRFPRSQCEVIP